MNIPGYDAWRLSPPDDDQIGTDEGDTCNRNGCDGMIGPDDEGDLMCGVCECRADYMPDEPDGDYLYERERDRKMERGE